jgi:hypothetical protein
MTVSLSTPSVGGARIRISSPSCPSVASGAVAVGLCGFLFRLLADGRLPNDHYMHLALAQQVLLGRIPGRDFVDPGMPLMISLSAMVQRFWPGPFSEVVLTSAMIGAAAALTYCVVVWMTRSRVAGVAAALIELALQPRLYGYSKVLIPSMVLTAFFAYAHVPSIARLAFLGAVTTLAVLLRHDLGVFAFVATTIGIVVLHGPRWTNGLREMLCYGAIVAGNLCPYLFWVQRSGGIAERIREGLEFSKGEEHQLLWSWTRLPSFDPTTLVSDVNAIVWLFYVSYALVASAALVILLRRTRMDSAALATAVSAVSLLACYCPIILRHPIASRLPDLAALLAIVGVWLVAACVVAISEDRRRHRVVLVVAVLAVFVTPTGISVWKTARLGERLEETRIMDGMAKVRERVDALAVAGSEWPWQWYWPSGEAFGVVPYLAECTRPDDRVLVTWFAPEFYYFAKRGFAAGHAVFASVAAFATEADQKKMVSRMRTGRVPVVFVNTRDHGQFAAAYPELDALVHSSYALGGEFRIRDGSRVVIGINRSVRPMRSYGPGAWPCQFEDVRSAQSEGAHREVISHAGD